MKNIIKFIKKDIVLAIAAVLALISMFFIPPSLKYLSYINFSVLGILFCLMAVVAGFMEIGVFNFISAKLLAKSKNLKTLTIILINCVFFSSMFFTNDVALIAFVPITIGIFNILGNERLIFIIVMETVAANMGSMITPIGNPQNLYIYSFYNMNIADFLKVVVPVGIIGYVIITCIILFSKNGSIEILYERQPAAGDIKPLFLAYYSSLFILCILTVLHVLDYRICVIAVLASIVIVNRKLLKKVDYNLLLTFVAFFIFTGNIEQINIIKTAINHFITGRTFILSVLTSQIISNVPAAMMISRFTNDANNLLLGVDVGGIGTLVASLASLISFKLYSKSSGAKPAKYLLTFTVYNAVILVLLSAVVFLIY